MKSFVGGDLYKEDLPEVPDIFAEREKHGIVQFELEPGDCVIHHGLLVHARRVTLLRISDGAGLSVVGAVAT